MSVAVKHGPELPAPALPVPAGPLYRFSVEQYHRMIEAGVLTEDDRAELLEGVVTYKMTHNPPHDATISLLQSELLKRLPDEWVLRIQSAITLADSEPEPDLAGARGPARRYLRAHPGPRDLPLLIEVAETTLLQESGDEGARLRPGAHPGLLGRQPGGRVPGGVHGTSGRPFPRLPQAPGLCR